MSDLLSRRLALLERADQHDLLRHCRHGLEKESLRVDPVRPPCADPASPGAGLGADPRPDHHRLLRGAAGVHHPRPGGPAQTFDELDRIHRFACAQLGEERLWTHSMPCTLPGEADIPIAEYGTSHVGRIKHVYRKGLAVRYGKAMQCIAGIHYNFSLPEALWPLLQQAEADSRPAQAWQSARYVALIRNFRRYSWLLMYLFGASPALGSNFLAGRAHDLEALDADTLYLPWATSLRMSDLGYQNNAQANLKPCYNDLGSYLSSLRQAVSRPTRPTRPSACAMRRRRVAAAQHQRAADRKRVLLSIRPKRVAESGERPIQAQARAGCTSRCAAWTSIRSCRWASTWSPRASSTPSACSARWTTARTWTAASAANAPPTSP